MFAGTGNFTYSAVPYRGMTELVLHEAAVNGEYQQLESMLMIHRIDLDHKDEDFGDRTALHWAASRGWRICHLFVNLVLNFYSIASASFPVSVNFTIIQQRSTQVFHIFVISRIFGRQDIHDLLSL